MNSIPVIDYTAAFIKAYLDIPLGIISVVGRGPEVLILASRDNEQEGYYLEYRLISQICRNENDEAWRFMVRSIVSFWIHSDIPDEVFTGDMTLFDAFATDFPVVEEKT